MKSAKAVLILVAALISSSPVRSAQARAVGAATDTPASVRLTEPPECAPYPVKPGTPISTPEQTRRVAMAYFEAGYRQNVEEMDRTNGARRAPLVRWNWLRGSLEIRPGTL